MSKTVKQLLSDELGNHIFPFFWQHGEDEATLRKYMKVINEANINSVCVESRPHPDFCGEKWWTDMDIILDEARKRNMTVWILDDSHFPTGFANGAALNAPLKHRRQSVYCKIYENKNMSISIGKIIRSIPNTMMGKVMNIYNQNFKYKFDDDRVLSVCALFKGEELPREIPYEIKNGKVTVKKQTDAEKIYITVLTRNAGIHRSYINMLCPEACKILLDAVYEPHYEKYKDDFGKTIAGFFSDEPELGNGRFFDNSLTIGTDIDLPWSEELQTELCQKWGNINTVLPVLWDSNFSDEIKSEYRYSFMDTVTTLVQSSFSEAIGSWCEAHGVKYIGHIIEDSNAHARLGCSLGHYYRGLSGQHMAGIDSIGGQVIPGKEDTGSEGLSFLYKDRDGEFFHFMLGKLASSSAQIDPKKSGNSMCEIFGNFGWGEGVRLEKYLCDHYLSRGVNNFVPHAFSPKKYPDPDCPPHFYAHGHNPQYRAFGSLMAYVDRISSLISDGKADTDIAVMYHGDFEWSGKTMLTQKITRLLTENQLDCHIIPCDVFEDTERYQTSINDYLTVNSYEYKVLIVPYCEFIPEGFAKGIERLKDSHTQVIFIDALPKAIVGGMPLPEAVKCCTVKALSELENELKNKFTLSPESRKMRIYHYISAENVYFIFNESDKEYKGTVSIPDISGCYGYDAFENKTFALDYAVYDGKAEISLSLAPYESLVIVSGKTDNQYRKPQVKRELKTDTWQKSRCSSVDYPQFEKWSEVKAFGDESKHNPFFSGYYAYKSTFTAEDNTSYILTFEDAGESAEVFINEKSVGVKVNKPFVYDISDYITQGKNTVRIEVATTLERERKANLGKQNPTGLLGQVKILY